MIFGKKRTTKEIGQDISKEIQRVREAEKVKRALEKERALRLKRQKAEQTIKELRRDRPSKLKTLKTIGRGVLVAIEQGRRVQKKQKTRTQKVITRAVKTKKRKGKKIKVTTTTVKRVPVKRRIKRRDDIMDLVRSL